MQSDPAIEDARRGLTRLGAMMTSRRNAASIAAAAAVQLPQQSLRVLEALDRPGAPAQIARRAAMDPAAVSRQLRTLEADGLVVRRAATADEQPTVALTKSGSVLVGRVRKVRHQHLLDAIEEWSEEDRQALGVLLTRLVDDLARTPFRPLRVRNRT
jgi:MarR family transcriptional regulator, organic hydroperoxide resistance regulator